MGKRLVFLSLIMIVLLAVYGCEDKITVILPEDTQTDTVFDTIIDSIFDSLLDTTGMPTVEIIYPFEGDLISDHLKLQVKTTDDKGVIKVVYYADSKEIATTTTPPFDILWLGGNRPNGSGIRFYARANDADGNVSTTSKTVTCFTDTSQFYPAAPYLNNPEVFGGDSIRISWTKINELDMSYYKIRWDTSSTHLPSMFAKTISQTHESSVMLYGMHDYTFYRFSVEAVDVFEHSTISNIRDIITPNEPPNSLSMRNIRETAEGISLEWYASDIWDFVNYKVYRSYDLQFDEFDIQIGDIDVQDSTILLDSDFDELEENVYYFISVKDRGSLVTMSGPFEVGLRYVPHSLWFSGSQYASVLFFAELNLGSEYTLEAWVKPEQSRQYAKVIDKSPSGDPYFQYSLTCTPAVGSDFCNGTGYDRVTSGSDVPLNQWSHIAFSYDNGVLRFYVNGIKVRTTQASGNSSCDDQTPLVFGRRTLYNEFYFNGNIDEVRIWNIVRDDDQISDNYNKYIPMTELGLVEFFGFDEGEGDEITGGKGHTGYLGNGTGPDQNDPIWTEDVAPIVK